MGKNGLLSCQELADAMPEIFSGRGQVMSWVNRAALPYYAVPCGTKGRKQILFSIKEVKQVLAKYKRGARV